MFAVKTIRMKLVHLTNTKRNKIEKEYRNFNELIELERNGLDFTDLYDSIPLYSTNRQQALRLKKPKREQPLIIRNDLVKIDKKDTKIAKYWARIPVYKKSIRVAVEIPRCHEGLLSCELREGKLVKRGNNWYLHVMVRKEVQSKHSYSNIIAVDMGERVTATVCGSFDGQKPLFLGRNIRGIRRHYAWLRKRLGNKKLVKMVNKIGSKEQRKADHILHEISKEIVGLAANTDSAIFLGDLKGIRKSAKGRRFNRIVSNMPYDKLSQMIEYKAKWEGIKVVKISEAYTSKACSSCGSLETSRPSQGRFRCKYCGYELNADLNGAKNILKRSFGYMLEDGAILDSPLSGAPIPQDPHCFSGG